MKVLINFYANVSEKTVNDMIMFLTQQIATNWSTIEEIIIQISSSWWSSDHWLLAYNFLKQINIPKTVIWMWNVDSAAVMIFSAWDKRLSMPSCRFLLHEARATMINWDFNSTKLSEIAWMLERITDDYIQVVTNISHLPIKSRKKKIKTIVHKWSSLSWEEAKDLWLVTEIIVEPYLQDMTNLAILVINNPNPPSQQLTQTNWERIVI